MAYPQDYAIAAGWNAADGSLTTVKTLLAAYVNPYTGVALDPASGGLVDLYPIRTPNLNGQERGDGMVNNLFWLWTALPVQALRYLLSTYWASSGGKGVPLTIVTPRYDMSAVWVKANVYAQYPQAKTDFGYDSNYAVPCKIRFGDFIQLSP